MYLFIQDLFQVTFVNYKIQSKRVTVKCSHNIKPRLLEENSCLQLLAMYYWNESFLYLTPKTKDFSNVVVTMTYSLVTF